MRERVKEGAKERVNEGTKVGVREGLREVEGVSELVAFLNR